MTIAAKHFDPQLGIDIHLYLIPPSLVPVPLPTPHIGIVLDPFDYIPVIGGTVQVNGIKRATAGSMGLDIHIPVGGVWMPTMKMPMGPQWEDEIFMGSKTVLADGEPFSRVAMPVLACNIVGMVAPFRPKPKKPHASLLLPTTLNLAIPTNVFVGGPPTVSWTSLLFGAGLAGLGKVLKKSRIARRASKSFKKVRQKLFENMEPGFLKCVVLRAEPVDIRDGSVSVEHEDFSIPGRLPLTWTRRYSSVNAHAGLCGHGWQTPADIRLEVEPDGTVLFVDAASTAVFPQLPVGEGIEHAVREFVDGARLFREGHGLWVRTKEGLRHGFAADPANVAANVAALQPQALPIERIEDLCGNHWRFERRDGQLVRIVESGVDGLQGRYLDVQTRRGLIERLQLHDPATGISHPLVSYRHDGDGDLVAALDALDAARTFEYQQHRLLRHTDRVGLSFYYAYNARWQAIHAWGDGGLHDYRFRYDSELNETEITDSLGHVSIVKFDDNGLPLCEIDPLDGVTVFEYDDVGRTTAVVDPMGLRTEFAYDERGNVLAVTRADAATIRMQYDDADLPTENIDSAGSCWQQQWDDRGRLVSQRTPLGALTSYSYDAAGQRVTQVNARGAVTHIGYDRHGQVASVTDALGFVDQYQHDAMGRLLASVRAGGRAANASYDAKGRLLHWQYAGAPAIECEYDAEDRLTVHRDSSGAVTRLQYSGVGNLAVRRRADGGIIRYEYDSEERLAAVVNQRGERFALARDALGRVVEETDYWGQSRHFDYDAAGRLLSTRDPLDRLITIETDAIGRITRKRMPDPLHPGRCLESLFAYNKTGQLVEGRNADRRFARRFDADGRLVEEEQDGFTVSYAYDAVGNRIGRESAAGNRVAYRHDLCDRPCAIAINDESEIGIDRDAMGRILVERLGRGIERHSRYDSRGAALEQSVHRDSAPLFDVQYDYDAGGNLTTRRDSRYGVDQYVHDVIGRLVSHIDPLQRVQHFLHDAVGDRLQTVVENGQWQSVVGDDARGESWQRTGRHDGVDYTFDRAGSLVRRGRAGGARGDEPAEELDLVWDAGQRLVESRGRGAVVRYGYDVLGRRAYKKTDDRTTWYYWDGDTLLAEVSDSDVPVASAPAGGKVVDLLAARQWRESCRRLHGRAREYLHYPGSFVPLALIQPSASALSTDASTSAGAVAAPQGVNAGGGPATAPEAGLPTAVSPRADAGTHAAIELTQPSAPAISLGVAADHSADAAVRARQAPAPGGFGGLGALALACADGRAHRQTGEAPGALSKPESLPAAAPQIDEPASTTEAAPAGRFESPSRVFHYHCDPNGCPTRMTAADGSIVWSARFGPWGADARTDVELVGNPLRMQGQYVDEETGLSYNRSRYYDPHVGQYISQDPAALLGGVSLYAYGINPLTWVDPCGLSARPPNSRVLDKWLEKGGSVWVELDTRTWVYQDWDGNIVRYPDGYPDFSPYELQRVDIPDLQGNHGRNPGGDFGKADAAARKGPADLSKNTWHHHQNGVTMIEVPKTIHNRFTHSGGVSTIKNNAAPNTCVT